MCRMAVCPGEEEGQGGLAGECDWLSSHAREEAYARRVSKCCAAFDMPLRAM